MPKVYAFLRVRVAGSRLWKPPSGANEEAAAAVAVVDVVNVVDGDEEAALEGEEAVEDEVSVVAVAVLTMMEVSVDDAATAAAIVVVVDAEEVAVGEVADDAAETSGLGASPALVGSDTLDVTPLLGPEVSVPEVVIEAAPAES